MLPMHSLTATAYTTTVCERLTAYYLPTKGIRKDEEWTKPLFNSTDESCEERGKAEREVSPPNLQNHDKGRSMRWKKRDDEKHCATKRFSAVFSLLREGVEKIERGQENHDTGKRMLKRISGVQT